SLLWGGSEGVLAFREADPVLAEIPFVLVAVEGISPLTYRLARYQLLSARANFRQSDRPHTVLNRTREVCNKAGANR
ncbi:MAG: hypothetical protein WBW33_35910, partial [Bryobacteraceae bacterium]